MVLLVHHTVSPFCRKARIILSEKKMLFVLKEEEPWRLSADIQKINPSGQLPVLIFDGNAISGDYAVSEYLEELGKEPFLLPTDPLKRAEVRGLCSWFDNKFYHEVFRYIVGEKVIKRFENGQAPNSKILKAGQNNLNFHLEYLDWLAEKSNYLCGDMMSLADISAAAQLSVIDYLGDIYWDNYKNARLWYSKMKSRPSFKDVLKDTIRGITPSKNYRNLDF